MLNILEYLLAIPIVLFALTFHEVCHGLVAHWLGDDTAKNDGRLTLNPLKHLDPIGFICMVLFHFGWAKPVQINPRNFKNPKAGMAISALAGPVSNLLLGFIFLLIYNIMFAVYPVYPGLYAGAGMINVLYYFFKVAVQINLMFAVFNMIPVPPLDGSRIMFSILPQRQYFAFMRYERQIMIGFMIFILADRYLLYRFTGVSILSTVLVFCMKYIVIAMQYVIGLIPFL